MQLLLNVVEDALNLFQKLKVLSRNSQQNTENKAGLELGLYVLYNSRCKVVDD